MLFKESETVELKQIVVDDIKKEALAFLNTNGGVIYIGVADDGKAVGIADPESTILQINNMLRDSIKPDPTMFVHSSEEMADEKRIIAVSVQRGTERPYYLAGKGLRPEGVYIRHGSASVPAAETVIRRMIKETDGESYEDLRSMNQALSFETAQDEFRRQNIDMAASQMMTLGLMMRDRIYTNLGALLSDQCVHSIKIAVFQDDAMRVFKDRREFDGSLLKQLHEAYAFIDLHNPVRATFDGLRRTDTRDFPVEAVREALLNALVHREYAMNGSILIKMSPDRVEFISIGGLVHGIELADIMSGYSICRNQKLAAVFYRLRLIEAYGTGMQRITEAYAGSEHKPQIDVTPNVFKVVLPNINAEPGESADGNAGLTQEEKVLRYAQKNGSINRKQAEHLLGVSQTAAGTVIRKLVERGRLIRGGCSRNIRYFAV